MIRAVSEDWCQGPLSLPPEKDSLKQEPKKMKDTSKHGSATIGVKKVIARLEEELSASPGGERFRN